MSIAGLGLLLLKRWGYLLSVASQILLLLATLATAFSQSLETKMRTAMSGFGLPEPFPSQTEAMIHYMRYFMLLGLLFPLAILILLLLYRRPFLAAAGSASSRAVSSS
jgi:hypothetical protein